MDELLTETMAAQTTSKTEVQKGIRGRPRKHDYTRVSTFLANFERQKAEYEEAKRIAMAIHKATQCKLEASGSGVYRGQLDGPDKEGVAIKDKGEFLVCTTCGIHDVNPEFCYDPDHTPPRVRVKLSCGHLLDLKVVPDKPPKKCPKCGGEVQHDTDDYFCVLCSWKASRGLWE
jgi:rubrerythrin